METPSTFTGERVIGNIKNDLFYYSKERYIFAKNYLKSADEVLDIACGTGYGSVLLAKKAKKVTGVDIDNETIDYCKKNIQNSKIQFDYHGNESKSDFLHKFDRIVCLETIEHVPDYDAFLTMLRSYLKKNGTLILSTPNNYLHTHPSKNPFHVYEFDLFELYKILMRHFPKAHIEVFGQKLSQVKKNDEVKKIPLLRRIIIKLIQTVYDLDKKIFSVLDRLSDTPIYKYIGRIQHDSPFDPQVYTIDVNSNYFQPHISVFVITLK